MKIFVIVRGNSIHSVTATDSGRACEIGITSIGEFLVADPEWIPGYASLTSKRVLKFQNSAYSSMVTEVQHPPDLLVLTPIM